MTGPVTAPSTAVVVVARRESEAGAKGVVRLLAGSGIDSWVSPKQAGTFWRVLGVRPWFAIGVAPAQLEHARRVIDEDAAAYPLLP